jgi:RNA polymerase sigma-70 factor (ECF subfamily)
MSAALLAVLSAPFDGGSASGADDLEIVRRLEAEARLAEQALVARLRDSDESACRELVETYFPRLARFAFGIVGAQDVADDIAQDVLAQVWEQRTTWTLEHSLKAYLFGATRNRALNELKRRHVRERKSGAVAESLAYRAGQIPDVVDQMSTDAMVGALRAAVAELPERRRTALRLRYEEGLTYPAISTILGVSVKSAEQLVALTVQSLRTTLRRFR